MRMVRSLLLLVSDFLAVTACVGGTVLIVEAHGNPLGIMPQRLLAHSPFRSFLFPGIFLFGGVGLFGIWTLWANLRRQPNSGIYSALEGVLLLCWTASCQMPHGLNYSCVALATILITSGLGLQSLGLFRN